MLFEGQIVDAHTGYPVSGAEVACSGPGGLFRRYSDEGGYFRFYIFDGGPWQIFVQKSPYSQRSRRFILSDAESFVSIDLEMEGLEEDNITA